MAEWLDEFQREGFVVLRSVLRPETIRDLKLEAIKVSSVVSSTGFDIVGQGCIVEPFALWRASQQDIESKEDVFESRQEYEETRKQVPFLTPAVPALITGDWFLSNIVGPVFHGQNSDIHTVYLFNEQYIIKPPYTLDSEFRPHRDSDYMNPHDRSADYLSVWIPLGHVDQTNGGLYFIPKSVEAQHPELFTEEALKALSPPYFLSDTLGPHMATPVLAPGDIILISSSCLHGSFPNASGSARPAYMPQFTTGPVRDAESGALVGHAIPLPLPNTGTQ